MAIPRKGKFPGDVTITWSDGSNFNGIAWFGIVTPLYGGTEPATSVDWGDFYPQQKIPTTAGCPIIDGKFNTSLGLFYNEDLTPPNSKYVMRIYDTTLRLLYGPSLAFTVNSETINLPSVSPITVPSSGSSGPTPD